MSVTIPFEAATSSTSGYGDIGVCADTWTTMNASASARPSRRADTWTKTIQLPANAKAAAPPATTSVAASGPGTRWPPRRGPPTLSSAGTRP